MPPSAHRYWHESDRALLTGNRPGLNGARLLTLAGLAVTIAYTIALAYFEERPLAGIEDTVAKTVASQIVVTTVFHIAIAAIALLLVVLRRRFGYALAAFIGVATLILFAVAAAVAGGSGPSPAPIWLQLIGAAASLAMVLGGILGWRRF